MEAESSTLQKLMDPKASFAGQEEQFAFKIENIYKVQDIIEGFNIHVCLVKTPHELEIELQKLNPSDILMLEPHLDFMRVVEVYEAHRQFTHKKYVDTLPQENLLEKGKLNALALSCHRLDDLKLHLMVFKNSAEKYLHMSLMEEEKRAFKALIEMKPNLSVDLKDYNIEEQIRSLDLQQDNERVGGSRLNDSLFNQAMKDKINADSKSVKNIIAVDSREFSSSTPIHLYEKGFWIVPMQLTVGDYILSDEICIERKSVITGDLFESFKSGRLLQQISNMNQFYKKPVLLIEFDESIPFKLQDIEKNTTAGAEISGQSVISKISLLTLHFPNLQIIWSKSPMHTAEICRDLKKNLPGASKDPDLLKIEKIGKVGSIDLDGEADQAEEGEFNRLMPREFLKRVPGVTSNNINVIMKSVKNIIELVRLPEDNLKELVGPKSAKLIKNFFETKVGGGIYGDSDEDVEEELPPQEEKVGEYEKFKQAQLEGEEEDN